MDPNSKQSVDIDAVGSLASDFGQLNPSTSVDGPINRMPNEIMQLIMGKLELNGDVTNLVRLRSVSTKWKALVEDYFEQKKSLIVVVIGTNTGSRFHDKTFLIRAKLMVPWFRPNLTQTKQSTILQLQSKKSYYYEKFLEKRFFGFANFKHCTLLFLDSKMPNEYLRSLLKMFPNTVQLSISCFDNNRVPALVDHINSLDSLEQLELVMPFVPAAFLSPTWSKLEHFSIDVGCLDDEERLQLVSHLEPSCVRVYFYGHFAYEQVRQWHTNNPNWLASLTHLAISVGRTSEECAQVVHYLSEYATSVKLFNLKFTHPLEMTPILIRNLSRLTNLAELELWNVDMDIRELTQSIVQLTSISSVLSFKLNFLHFVGNRPSNGQFTRVLSVILPNLAQLDLSIWNQYLTQQFQAEFVQYLDRFPKLDNFYIYHF